MNSFNKTLLLTFNAMLSKEKGKHMEEPGLDNRHRDQNPPKAGQIDQKHGNTLNKHLPVSIQERISFFGWSSGISPCLTVESFFSLVQFDAVSFSLVKTAETMSEFRWCSS
jgi:hypothetical protein